MEIPSGFEVNRLFRNHFDLVARINPKGNFALMWTRLVFLVATIEKEIATFALTFLRSKIGAYSGPRLNSHFFILWHKIILISYFKACLWPLKT